MERPHINPSTITVGDRNVKFFVSLIKTLTGADLKFSFNSNMSDAEKCNVYEKYIKYYHKNVFYLPFKTPEEGIWDDECCRSHLSSLGVSNSDTKTEEILEITDFKIRYKSILNYHANKTADHAIDLIHDIFVTKFINRRGKNWDALIDLVNKIGDQHA